MELLSARGSSLAAPGPIARAFSHGGGREARVRRLLHPKRPVLPLLDGNRSTLSRSSRTR
jgi:hypothetical protein